MMNIFDSVNTFDSAVKFFYAISKYCKNLNEDTGFYIKEKVCYHIIHIYIGKKLFIFDNLDIGMYSQIYPKNFTIKKCTIFNSILYYSYLQGKSSLFVLEALMLKLMNPKDEIHNEVNKIYATHLMKSACE